ncbi:unnamed protein product, partial [Phaeothamnion confervicola]
WVKAGTSFCIIDMTAFTSKVLPLYFKHSGRFSSFQRQLNYHGFRKVVRGHESGCYMHPEFHRDRPENTGNVRRGVVP